MILFRRFLLIFLATVSSFALAEKTAYVTDNLSTAVRSGPTTEYRIVFYVPAGSQITVLDDPMENDFIKVRDDRGREGWTLEKFIVETKGNRVLLQENQAKLANALVEIENLKKKHQIELSDLSERLNRATETIEKGKSAQAEIAAIQTRNATLEQKNSLLADRFAQEFFFAGAVVVGVGALIGFVLGRIARKKRSSWN